MADPSMVTRGEEVRWWLISVMFTINLIIFVIRSRINAIKLCSLSLWTTHVRKTSFSSHSLKAKSMHAKVPTWTHSCYHLPWNSPKIMCGDAVTQSSFVYIITNRHTVISLNSVASTLSFLLHKISVCFNKGVCTCTDNFTVHSLPMSIIFTPDPWISQKYP